MPLPHGAENFMEYAHGLRIRIEKTAPKLATYESDIVLFPTNIRAAIRTGMKNMIDVTIAELNDVKTYIDTLGP